MDILDQIDSHAQYNRIDSGDVPFYIMSNKNNSDLVAKESFRGLSTILTESW
jgi:hypothetical protein